MVKTIYVFACCIFIINTSTKAQSANAIVGQPTRKDTLKGSVTPERAWWKVMRYDLTVKPNYAAQTVSGNNVISYRIVKPKHTPLMQIDLQAPLHIDSVIQQGKRLSFRQDGNVWFISIPYAKANVRRLNIYYSGEPKISINPPWDGGLIWTADSLNRPWMAVACQHAGADTWYPCKAYIGDKPDKGVSISIIAPDDLVGVANGRLRSVKHQADNTTCYQWEVLNPINNYGLTFYIGRYVKIANSYAGEKGKLDMDFWVLDYNKAKVVSYLIPEVHQTFKTFEHWFGPYPFYEDSFKMVESPYIGMEHQSAVGYGNHFEHGRYKAKRLTKWDMKTDRMVTHENAHEWFGNSITAKDPADQWIHEGFAGYAEELAIEDRYGKAAAEEFFLDRSVGRISNDKPVISRYNIFEEAGEDAYMKGWVLIHMIRAAMHNDQKFRKLLRGLSHTFYHQSVTTKQFEKYISAHSGINLNKFFDQYLRVASVPMLGYWVTGNNMWYRFNYCVPGFFMPLLSNWTGNKIITPTDSWKMMRIDTTKKGDTLKVKPDFYLRVKRLEAAEMKGKLKGS